MTKLQHGIALGRAAHAGMHRLLPARTAVRRCETERWSFLCAQRLSVQQPLLRGNTRRQMDLITVPGWICFDFSDTSWTLAQGGRCSISRRRGSRQTRAIGALDSNIARARALLVV